MLGYGEFLGVEERRLTLCDFTICYLRTGRAWDRSLHTHACANFLVPLDRGFFSEAWKYDPYAPGLPLIYTPPGTTHRDAMERPAGKFVTVSIGAALLDGLRGTGAVIDHPVALASPLVSYAAERIAATFSSHTFSDDDLEVLAFELMEHLQRNSDAGSDLARCVRHSLEILHGAGGCDVPVGALAKECGVHPVYLSRAFRRAMRCTPSQYAVRMRVSRATERLRRGSAALAEVAADTGFYDQSHMARCFRSVLGVTPGQYRDAFR